MKTAAAFVLSALVFGAYSFAQSQPMPTRPRLSRAQTGGAGVGPSTTGTIATNPQINGCVIIDGGTDNYAAACPPRALKGITAAMLEKHIQVGGGNWAINNGDFSVISNNSNVCLQVVNSSNVKVAMFCANGETTFASPAVGTITLVAGTGTATVRSGCVPVCTDTTANASVKCAVSGTTLTATGTTTDVIAYHCF